jgi:hypothetical protein
MELERMIHHVLKVAIVNGTTPSHLVMSNVFASRFLQEKGAIANGGNFNYVVSGNFDGRAYTQNLYVIIVDTNLFDVLVGYSEVGPERQNKWSMQSESKTPALPLPTFTLDFPLT